MLKVRLYSKRNQERGEVECEEIDFGGIKCYLGSIENIEGTVDILDILHEPSNEVSLCINILDLVSVKTL